MKFIFTLLVIISFNSVSFSQDSVTVAASKDNTLYETPDGAVSNGAGEHLFIGRTNQASNNLRRTVLQFDLSGKIPEGAQVTGAELFVHVSRISNANEQGADIYRLVSDWGEGTSNADLNEGSGAAATTGDATWIHRFFNTTGWSAAGGDFAVNASAQIGISDTGSYTFGTSAGIVSDVQGWIDNPSGNFGWIMIGNETTGQSSKRIDSRENAAALNRPQLKIHYTVSTGVKEAHEIPTMFSLYQNYPNPFNPSTSISYRTSGPGMVTLKVFDVLGITVATLISEVQAAGNHTVQFNASGLSSGLYYYRLQMGSSAATKKMTLLK